MKKSSSNRWRPRNKNRVFAVAAIIVDTRGRVLLIQRSANESWSGYWAFPGGGLDGGEAPEIGVVREIKEEVGLDITAERKLFTGKTPSGLPIEYWLGVAKDFDLELNREELSAYKWVSQFEILDMPDLLPAMSKEVGRMIKQKILPISC